jgi:8-oxo-dGTP diphosphatase
MQDTLNYQYKYPKQDNTSDVVLFGYDQEEKDLKILLVVRGDKEEIGYGKLAIPGGFLDMTDEDLHACAVRELKEETNIDFTYLEQLPAVSKNFRDPRQHETFARVITHPFLGITNSLKLGQKTDGVETLKVEWYSVKDIIENKQKDMFLDHYEIITKVLDHLRKKIWREPIVFNLIEDEFTLPELRAIYEIIEGSKLEPSNFRRFFESDKRTFKITKIDKKQEGYRPVQVYVYAGEKS